MSEQNNVTIFHNDVEFGNMIVDGQKYEMKSLVEKINDSVSLENLKTDIITRDVTRVNEEEEEITETLALNDILDGKAALSHTHEFADIYKLITVQSEGEGDDIVTTTKTLQQVLDEYEQSMMNAINEKANLSHTHKTDGITRDVTRVNEEEEEVTESVSLNDILDNKAESVHTHTSADIANWATATENFAKLSTANTFTATNTFSTINTNSINVSAINGFMMKLPRQLSKNEGTRFKVSDTSRNGLFALWRESDTGNYYTYMKLEGKSAEIDVYDSTVRIKGNTTLTGTLTTSGNITANGVNINTTLAGKAEAEHTHPSSQISDLNALKIEIFKMIYPIGSIYQSFEPIEAVSGGSTYYPQITWNDCVWQLLDSGQFLRSVSLQSAQLPGGGYGWTIGQSGVIDGSATHTHTTADHTITMQELPYRWWQFNAMNDKGAQNVTLTDYITCLVDDGSKYGVRYSYTGWGYGNPNGAQAHNHGNTGSASNLPPCITVYMYRRIA